MTSAWTRNRLVPTPSEIYRRLGCEARLHFCTNYHLLKRHCVLFSVWSASPVAAAVLHQTETSSSCDRVRGTHVQALWLLQSHSKWILLMDYLGLLVHHCQQLIHLGWYLHHCQRLIHLGWCRLLTALAGDGSGNTQIHPSPQNERRRPSGLPSGTPRGCSPPAETKNLGVSSFGVYVQLSYV